MLFVLLIGCALLGPDETGREGCDREPPLTWENFGEAIMTRHCTGCHSSLLPEELREEAPLGVDFDTYAGVLAWADRVRARSTGAEPTMPPSGGPSAEELVMLAEWLDCAVAEDLQALEGR